MEYHDQPLQFINNHYFHSKTEGDDHYDNIEQILRFLAIVKPSILQAMLFLSVIYIIPKLTEILQKLSKIDITDTSTEPLEDNMSAASMSSVINMQRTSKIKNYEAITMEVSNDHGDEIDQDLPSTQWKLSIISTFLVNLFIAGFLSVLNILCMKRLQQYGSEVLMNPSEGNILL